VTADNNATATSDDVALTFTSLFLTVLAYVAVTPPVGGVDLEVRSSSLRAFGNITVKPPSTGIDLTVRDSTLSGLGYVTVTNQPTGTSLQVAYKLELDPGFVTVQPKPISLNLTNLALTSDTQNVVVTGSADFDAGKDGIGVCEVIREIFRLWAIDNPCSTSDSQRERAINDLNAALQTLWTYSRDRDYWTRAKETVTVTGGTSFIVLDNTIQNVIGPARLNSNKKPLVPLNSISEVENYDLYFQGGISHSQSSGEAKSFYIERTGQTGNDPAKCTLHLAPIPTTDTELIIDVIKEAPRYTWGDYVDCTRIPVPHQYVENVLLPICRFKAMGYRFFSHEEQRDNIQQEYAIAISSLELNDPLTTKEEADKQPRE
jgi:hypothetical protein